MQPISWFRGAGGEMVRIYVSPLSYLSAIPIAVLVMVITAGLGAMGKNGVYLAAPALFFFYVLVIMRIAVPASRGKLDPSNDFGELFSYSCRYAAVTLAWMIPVVAAVAAIFRFGGSMLPAGGFPNPLNLNGVGFLGIILLLLLIAAAFLPTLSLLVVLRHDSLRDVFSAAAWRWLLVDRQEDLLPFYSLLFGGAIAMAGVSLIPAALVLYFAMQVSLEAVGFVSGALYVWAGSTVPILTGLMAGAFVATETSQKSGAPSPVFTPDGPTVLAKMPVAARGTVVPTVAEEETPVTLERRPDVRQIEQRLSALSEQEVTAALAAASEKGHQAPLLASLEKSLLCLRMGDRKAALEAASTGANLAAQRGFADIGVYLFSKLGEDRMRLSLEPQTLELMGKVLEQRLMYMDAAWCFHTAAVRDGDLLKAQKRLFQIAEVALKEGKLKEAQALFELLLRKYPESTLRDFARQGLDRVCKFAGKPKGQP